MRGRHAASATVCIMTDDEFDGATLSVLTAEPRCSALPGAAGRHAVLAGNIRRRDITMPAAKKPADKLLMPTLRLGAIDRRR